MSAAKPYVPVGGERFDSPAVPNEWRNVAARRAWGARCGGTFIRLLERALPADPLASCGGAAS